MLEPILSSVAFILILAVAVVPVVVIANAVGSRRRRHEAESLGPRLSK